MSSCAILNRTFVFAYCNFFSASCRSRTRKDSLEQRLVCFEANSWSTIRCLNFTDSDCDNFTLHSVVLACRDLGYHLVPLYICLFKIKFFFSCAHHCTASLPWATRLFVAGQKFNKENTSLHPVLLLQHQNGGNMER